MDTLKKNNTDLQPTELLPQGAVKRLAAKGAAVKSRCLRWRERAREEKFRIFFKRITEANKEFKIKNIVVSPVIDYSKTRQQRYNIRNKTKISEKAKAWRKEHREIYLASHRASKAKRKEKIKEYRKKSRHTTNKRARERRKTDIGFALLCKLRSRIAVALKRNIKSAKTKELIGCTVEYLKTHLEAQFKDGMGWDNHGHIGNVWHIDHIIPCASFDLSKADEQRKCFHYTNLQPLWQKDNMSKGCRLLAAAPFAACA